MNFLKGRIPSARCRKRAGRAQDQLLLSAARPGAEWLWSDRPCLAGQLYVLLRFEGIDTIADIYVNGRQVGNAFNMHNEIQENDISDVSSFLTNLHEKYERQKPSPHNDVSYIIPIALMLVTSFNYVANQRLKRTIAVL